MLVEAELPGEREALQRSHRSHSSSASRSSASSMPGPRRSFEVQRTVIAVASTGLPLRGPAQSQPLSWYHFAVRWTPSLKRTSGFQPRSSCVFVLSQTQWCRSIATFSRVSITALPRTLP